MKHWRNTSVCWKREEKRDREGKLFENVFIVFYFYTLFYSLYNFMAIRQCNVKYTFYKTIE